MRDKAVLRRRPGHWLVPGLVVLPATTLAQSVAPPAPAASAQTLAPVTIEGRREAPDYRAPSTPLGALGNLRPIDTPFATSTLTRQLLDNQQATAYNDYLKNDPSVTFGNVPVGFASLRGFSLGIDGYLFDGLPGALGLSDARYQLQGFDRIDVLKGPAAFLYGLGTSTSLGGTLNFVPKKPPETPVREASLGYISRSVRNAAVDLGDRFGPDRAFGYRFNAIYRDGEQASRHADWNQKAGTLALDWRATRDLVVSGGFEYARNRYPSLQPFYFLAAGVDVPKAPDSRRNVAQRWDDFEVIATTAYVRADWQLAPSWTLRVSGLRGTDDRPSVKEARFGQIADAEGNAFLFSSQDESKQSARTAQASLHGDLSTGSISHQVTIAATRQLGRTRDAFQPIGPGLVPTNIYSPVDSPEPAGAPAEAKLGQVSGTTSLLASDIVKFGPRWSILAGVRYVRRSSDSFDDDGQRTTSTHVVRTQPIGALVWKPTDASLVYVNYGEGLEEGGTVSPLGSGPRLPPVVTRQSEVGAKYDTGRMLLTASAFQLRRPLESLDPATNLIAQRGTQRHRGVELAAHGQATGDLAVVAGAMFLDPKALDTGDGATDGNRPPGVPKTTVNVFLDYRLPWNNGLFVNGGVYHAGPQYLDLANTQRVPSWTRLDLGARWETRVGNFRTAFYAGVENVLGRDYWSGAQGGLLTLAEPRTFKLTARVAL